MCRAISQSIIDDNNHEIKNHDGDDIYDGENDEIIHNYQDYQSTVDWNLLDVFYAQSDELPAIVLSPLLIRQNAVYRENQRR